MKKENVYRWQEWTKHADMTKVYFCSKCQNKYDYETQAKHVTENIYMFARRTGWKINNKRFPELYCPDCALKNNSKEDL